MTTMNNETMQMKEKCCVENCETSFEVSGEQITNSYKCRQRKFAASDLWQIQKGRRVFTRRFLD